jgi:LysM repeat protein
VPRGPDRISARLLAPVALGVFAVVFLIVVVISLGGDSDSNSSERATRTSERTSTRTRTERTRAREGTTTGTTGTTAGASGATDGQDLYVVEAGDTLSTISAKTGVAVADLQALNPDVDPQALVAGQKIKLRE